MSRTDHTLVAAIARGLTALGLPSVERNCAIKANRLTDTESAELQIEGSAPYLVTVRFTRIKLPTLSDAWRSDNWYRPEAQFSLQPGPDFTDADLLGWAYSTVPRLALTQVREDCRRKGVVWPHDYPVVFAQAA